jgi:hypothetical protein
MPEPAAELVVYFYGSSDESETADEVVGQYGFHPAEVDGSVITMDQYTAYHYQPFEAREDNAELLDECVEELKEKFPEMEVWLRNRPNKDYGSPVSEDYLLYIAPSRDVVEKDRKATTNSISGSDTDKEGKTGQDVSSEIDSTEIDWKAKDRESESDSTNNTTKDSDTPEWRAFGDSNDREKKRVRASYDRSAGDSISTDTDTDTEQQESNEPSGPPDNCIDCDSQNIESVQDESDEFICSDCGLVMKRRNTEIRSNFLDKDGGSDYVRADWSKQTSTGIVGIITEPYRRHHEYYRIENPREFFKDCSGEEEQKQRIKQSNLEPFETLDLPPIDWRYSD